MGEKRHAHRLRVNLRARYRSDSVALEGWVANISRFGLFLRADFLDAEGTQVSLYLTLPGHQAPLCIPGEVIRVDPAPLSSGMAIRFGQIPPSTRRLLANFMIERSYLALHQA
jgi:uncharacterized protein (TIGR02266 family)